MVTSNQRKQLWKPQNPGLTQTDRFRESINRRHSLALKDYAGLHAYSVATETASDFWVDLFLFLKIKSDGIPRRGLEVSDVLFPPPKFFPEIRLNFAENLLSGKDPSAVAIHACNEGGANLHDVTWGELIALVQQIADALISFGVRPGDRIAGVITNRVETVAIALASLSMGALWSSSSPDMGVQGILDRLLQIRPKIVFGDIAIRYNGKDRDLRSKIASCAKALHSTQEFEAFVVIPKLGDVPTNLNPDNNITSWDQFLRRGIGRELAFKKLPFSHPGFIVFSSGTTGAPKCIVHSAAGLLLQVQKDSVLGFDAQSEDIMLQYTTTGWIMWAMVLCGLAYAKRVVIYDGSPLMPDKLALLRLVDKLKVTIFGTSARFLSDLKAEGIKPRDILDLGTLRTITSTGSSLTADVANWFYEEGFPIHIHLVSTCGGTDLACSLVSGNPTLPVYSGEIQCKSLGMAVDIASVDDEHFSSIENTGEPGELVCTQPFPSMPVMFWGKNGAEKYQSSYFERFGVKCWNQGDFTVKSRDTGGFEMLGRSDGVLNPSGVRFGSAEIYEVVEKMQDTGIEDTLCVGQRRPQDDDESVILFVKMTDGRLLNDATKDRIRNAIRTARSPRHVPKHIFQVAEIPYTVTGKKIEIAIKKIISGKTVPPSGAVANPRSFELYKKYVEIEKVSLEEAGYQAKL